MTKEEGRQAAIAWNSSPAFRQFDRSAGIGEIMALFLPPIQNDMMQVSRPLPKPYRDWIDGFEDEVNKKRHCD